MSRRRGTAFTVFALAPALLVTALSTSVLAAIPTTTTTPRAPTTSPVPATTASSTPTSGATVTRPQTGDTIVNTGLEIVGTAPPAWLVAVSIVDTDRSRTEIQHQPGGRVDGSVTSDATGHWVFVPQVNMTPGAFEVSASYLSADNQTFESPAVRFIVVNEAGESSIPSATVWWKIAFGVVLLVGGAAVAYRLYQRRRHPSQHSPGRPHLPRYGGRSRAPAPQPVDEGKPLFMSTSDGQAYQRNQAKKMQGMEDEMRVIQRALADSAEALERSNRAITALHRQIRDEYAANAPEPEPEVAVVAAAAKHRAAPKKPVAHRGAITNGDSVGPKRNGGKKVLDPRVVELEADWGVPTHNGATRSEPPRQD